MNSHDRRKFAGSFLAALLLIALGVGGMIAVFLLSGCATGAVIERDVPGEAKPTATGGFLHWIYAADGRTHVGVALSAEGRDTYNYLLEKFGQDLKPPRTKDFGVTINGAEFDLNEEAAVDMGLMATWDRSNEHPKKTLIQKAVGL